MSALHGQAPALDRAIPADAVPGSWQPPHDASALVLLTDGTWAELDVRGWRKDTRERWCIELRWYETGVSEMSDWYVFDRGRIKSLLVTDHDFYRPNRCQVRLPAKPARRDTHRGTMAMRRCWQIATSSPRGVAI